MRALVSLFLCVLSMPALANEITCYTPAKAHCLAASARPSFAEGDFAMVLGRVVDPSEPTGMYELVLTAVFDETESVSVGDRIDMGMSPEGGTIIFGWVRSGSEAGQLIFEPSHLIDGPAAWLFDVPAHHTWYPQHPNGHSVTFEDLVEANLLESEACASLLLSRNPNMLANWCDGEEPELPPDQPDDGGCSSVDDVSGWLAGLLLLAFRRRRTPTNPAPAASVTQPAALAGS